MLICKRCGNGHLTKNGMVRGKLRHKCKDCGLNFVEGDRRVKDSLAAKKALNDRHRYTIITPSEVSKQ